MALAIADLATYRHRKETVLEQNRRLEIVALSDAIAEYVRRTAPHRARLGMVARECGPTAWHSYAANEYELQRLVAQSEPEDAA